MAGAGSIDGIFSGLNTSSIIEAMMKYEHQQVDLYTARQAEYTQKLTAWQSINTYLLAFKTQADFLSRPALWNSRKVTSSDETKITATNSGSSASGTYFISVDQLAQNHQIASQGFSESSAIVGIGTIDIKVGSDPARAITLDAGSNSVEAVKNAINSAQAGVTAAVINDGSSSNPYRLILSANGTGASKQITVTSSLAGGMAPDFYETYFDSPEKMRWSSNATSSPSLGTGATYTGSTNKTYTFTVRGNGSQTVGDGPIGVNWTDGTHSGTITVNSAGEQVALTGDGADGLIVSFSSGALMAGDTFQIQAMTPTIQVARDAILRMGSSSFGGSPILVSSPSNKVTTLIDGITLNLQAASATPVQITVEPDYSNMISSINQFVEKYNAFAEFADKQLSYNSQTGTAGTLLGESSLITLLSDIRSGITQNVRGLQGALKRLADVGIRFNLSGKLEVDTATLTRRLTDSPDEVRRLFLASGSSNNSYVTYLSSGPKTVPGTSGYDVDITGAPLQGAVTGSTLPDPAVTNLVLDSTNNNIKIKVNGVSSNTISLAQGTYMSGEDLAREIGNRINADQALGSNEVRVAWVDLRDTGYFEITSTAWGSNSRVELDAEPTSSAHATLGLSNGISSAGADVAGTINGELADGVGQILTSRDGNATTAGLKLRVALTPDMLVDGPEARVVLTKGYASMVSGKLDNYTDPNVGILGSRARSIEKQIGNLKEQIHRMELMLSKRRESLYRQFRAMEGVLGRLQSQQAFLSSAVSSLNQLITQPSSSSGATTP